MKFVKSVLLVFAVSLAFAQPLPHDGSAEPAKNAKVSDLAFLSGRWTGSVDDAKIEQVCSTTDPDVMLCMFRLMTSKGTEMLELYTLRNTADGVTERIRFFSPDLKEEPGEGVTLRLTSLTNDKAVFENPNGTYPKRATLTHKSGDEFSSHIELVDSQGKESTIDAHWQRAQ